MTPARGRGTGRRYSGLDAEERVRVRRAAILEAALDLFGTVGYPATSVKQICDTAGLTERYFYESFRDRKAALAGVYGLLVTEVREATQSAIGTADGDLEARIRAGLTAFVGYLTDDPRRARVVLIEVVGISPELEEVRHAVLRGFGEVICAVWSTQSGFDATTEPARLTALSLSGAVNNLLVDWMMTGQQQDPRVLIEVSTMLFVSALAGLRTHLHQGK
ncbi:TetR/AcrR family transcriptional regulator [Rhodococcus sp. NPDC058532]|uniref:TetR/AcrR family transcriptional regulator n=1 Tax=Rhodococcus sp. NPDC058532 TaxID=3346540 RepID=UPI0036619B2F